ncbi:MAG: DUF1320 family protein [Bacteroidia bacterium]|nr:DUF1320 family protein [Bacteroidia bacterium]
MAIYKFITDQDLDVGMKQYFRDQITEGSANAHILKTSEGAAVSLIKSKLNGLYNLALVFPSILEWNGSKSYAIGDFSHKAGKIYKSKTANTNKNPESEAADWTEEDPRDQLIVVYCVAITLYFFVESVSPRKISEDIKNAYLTAIEWLEDVKDGKESPALPLLETGGSNDIPHGSNEPLDHYY